MTLTPQQPDDQVLTILPAPPVITRLSELGQAAAYAARGLDYLEQHKRTCSPQTRRRYRFDLAHFEAFLQSAANTTGQQLALDLLNNLQAWQGITPELLMAYQQAMENEGLATGTIRLRIYTIKAFCRVARKAGILDENTYGRIKLVETLRPAQADNLDANRRAAGLPTRKPQANAKKAEWTQLSVSQVKTLLKACGPDRRGVRDRLLILLAFRLGLRVGEIALLTLSSLDLEIGLLTLDRPKTHLKEQRLALPDEILAAAHAWLALRHQETSDPQAPLFHAERKPEQAPINEGTISRRIARLALVHLGLRHVSSHDGRHWWIDDAIANQVDVKTFTEAGGWKSPVVPLQMYASKARVANQGMRGTSLATEEEEEEMIAQQRHGLTL